MAKNFGLLVLASAAASLSASIAVAAPTNYTLLATLPTPTTLTAFDISYVDPVSGFYYFADRSDASIDIYNGATLGFVGQASGFQGVEATTSVSGPDGVVLANTPSGPILFGGDGNSTLRSYTNAMSSTPTQYLPPVSTGGTHRVDEMAYSPNFNLLLVANNADNPAFGTLINATTGAIVKSGITIPNSPGSAGLEQSVWDPNTNTFFISVPAFNGANDPGGVAEIDTSGNVRRTYDLNTISGGSITACSPTGLALGASGNLLIGCSAAGSQTVVLNPSGTGSIVASITAIYGSDEVWYDSASRDYFVTGVNAATGGRAFDVVSDATDTVLQSVALPNVNAHSIAVDPLNGDVFVPLENLSATGGIADPLCPNGCVAVFAQSVPEPASFSVLGIGLLGLAGLGSWRRLAGRRAN